MSNFCCACGSDIKTSDWRGVIGIYIKSKRPAVRCSDCMISGKRPLNYIQERYKAWRRRKRKEFYPILPDILPDWWQDEDRIWLEVERVYETRWDCNNMPERVWRKVA